MESASRPFAKQAKEAPVEISLARLLSSPQGLNGKLVTTTGVLAVAFEGTALYLNHESYQLKISENAIGLSTLGTNGVNWADFEGMYVTITGRYKRGPFAKWPSGIIGDIAPDNPPFPVFPYFAVTHAVISLHGIESSHFASVLHSFASKNSFHFSGNSANCADANCRLTRSFGTTRQLS